MPITDRTSWQLSHEGALRSFENETLFLPTPRPRTILRRRVEFLESRLAVERGRPGHGYFLQRGISLSVTDLTAFAAVLQAVFLRDELVSTWIGNLANNDIRRCLELAKLVISSPHIWVEDLLVTYLSKETLDIPLRRVRDALIRLQYDIYPGEINRFVRNIFTLDGEAESSPLTGLRILRFLEDARTAGSNFVELHEVISYMQAMQIEESDTREWLSSFLETGLCFTYDPTVTKIGAAGRLEVSNSGSEHLFWATKNPIYVGAMMEVTPIIDRDAYLRLEAEFRAGRRNLALKQYVKYLIDEDRRFVSVPDSDMFASQAMLTSWIDQIPNRRV